MYYIINNFTTPLGHPTNNFVPTPMFMCYGSVNIGGIFVEKLRELLGNRYAEIDRLNSIEKTVYVLYRK